MSRFFETPAVTGSPAFAHDDTERSLDISIRHHPPLDRFAAAIDQRALVGAFDLDLFGGGPGRAFERDRVLVGRQPAVPGAVEGREGFELVEAAFLLEHARIDLERARRIEHARPALPPDLPRHAMRSGIGAEEEAGLA